MSYLNNGSVSNSIAILKKCILIHKKECRIPLTKINYYFLIFLYKNGFIQKMVIRKNKVLVSLKIYQDRYVMHSIINYLKTGHLKSLNNKQISEMYRNKNIETLYVLWSNIGFITINQAYYRKIGGLLVCKIN